MYNIRMDAYEGDENYIFVSYAHADAEKVWPILDALNDKGYRIWFDDGIDPGTEWPADIEKHLNNCSAVISFISPKAVASANCRRELTLSLELRKPFVYVLLEQTKLAEGMSLQLAGQYCINKTALSDEKLIKKLCAAKALEGCKIGSSVPEPEPDSPAPPSEPGFPERLRAFIGRAFSWMRKGKRWMWLAVLILAIVVSASSPHWKQWISTHFPFFSSEPTESVPSDPPEPPQPENTEPVPSDPPEPPQPENTEPFYEFVLTPEEMSVKEYNQSAKTIQERLAVFADGADYTFSKEEDSLHVGLPVSLFEGEDPVSVMQSYLSRPIKLYLLDRTGAASSMFGNRYFLVDRDDIASVQLCYGAIDGVNPADYGLKESTYPYIELVLSDAFAEKCSEAISTWEALCFAQDVFSANSWYWYETFPQPDGKTYCLLDNTFCEHIINTTVYNYSHPPLAGDFSIKYNAPVVWEDPSAAIRRGASQVSENAIEDNFVILDYSTYERDNVTGKWLDTELAIKNRFDIIGQPYAIGTKLVSGYYHLLIKTDLSKIGPYLPQLEYVLCKYGTDTYLVHGANNYYNTAKNATSLVAAEVKQEDDGGLALRIYPKYSSYHPSLTFEEFAEQVCTPEDRVLMFYQNGLPLLVATPEDITGDYEIVYRHLYGGDSEPITEESRWLLELIADSINNAMRSSATLYPYQLEYDNEDRAASLLKDNIYRADEKALTAAIHAAVPSAVVTFGRPGSGNATDVRAYLDLNVDEDMPATALEQIKTIYSIVQPEKSRFSSLSFYFIDENNESFERARLFINVDYYSSSIQYYGIFKNGRLDKYREQYLDLLDSDPFFADKKLSSSGIS